MRITTLSQLLVMEEEPKWFKENGLRKRVSITFFPLSASETALSSKLQMTIQQFLSEFF